MFLAGDIGGTKTSLGTFEGSADRIQLLRHQTFASREFPGLQPIVTAFLRDELRDIDAACFGIAGPVRADRVETANLPWVVASEELASAFAIPRVELINDLVAMAAGIPALDADDLAVLQEGTADPDGSAALIAAGTGLGIAILAGRDGAQVTLPSEGGHSDFAPRNHEEIALLQTLIGRFGHVSLERVLSGPGLVNLYEHLRDSGFAPEAVDLAEALAERDPAEVIAEWGDSGRSHLCTKALEMFVRVYGASAGNLALLALSTRGLYLGGGIAPKMLARLQDGSFLEAFRDKGRYRKLLQEVPVRVILNPQTALLGAARRAAGSAAS
jgi:glucokinase